MNVQHLKELFARRGGMIVGMRLAIIDFPAPGGLSIAG
jgi:hypothetical protein